MASRGEGKPCIYKWLLPMLFAMGGFYCQSVGLHYATYSYVHKYAMSKDHPAATNPYATLEDPVEDMFGARVKIKLKCIDLIAALFPLVFVMGSAYLAMWHVIWVKQNVTSMQLNALQVWTKVMLCAGFLFTIKGTIGAVTTIPDSSGWEICKGRLTPDGVRWMREEHTLWDMFSLDFDWNFKYHHPLRYCSDMMYSGHTFVVTLFALGLYELIRMWRASENVAIKMAFLILVIVIAVGEQVCEIYVVERTHFHYTSDVLMALIMTFLFYTNGVMAISAKLWSKHGLGCLAGAVNQYRDIVTGMPSSADAWDNAWDKWHKALLQNSAQRWWKTEDIENVARNVKWDKFVSRGDIFVPPCCIPFCCLAGREHIYSDADLKAILDQFAFQEKPQQEILRDGEMNLNDESILRLYLQAYLMKEMNLNEGVSVRRFVKDIRNSNWWKKRRPAGDGYGRLP